MIEKPQDLHGLDPEEELKRLFQQLPPAPEAVPTTMHDNIHALLLEEVSRASSDTVSRSLKPQFPLAALVQRQLRRLLDFELGPSLFAAAMGAAAVLLVLGLYPYLRNLTTPSAHIVVLDSTSSNSSEQSVLIQSRYGDSLSLSEGDEALIYAGDQLLAWSSSVEIRYADGWKSILQPGSLLNVEALSKNRSEVNIDLYLQDGEIYTEIDRELGYSGSIAIQTDSSLVEAVGTEFVVRTDTRDISYVSVSEGEVEISNEYNSVSAAIGQEVLSVAGQKLVVSEKPEFSPIVNPSEPYVTAKNAAVSLYARPDANSNRLALMGGADRLELVGATWDIEWYQVCCIEDDIFSWVNSMDVVPHNTYGDLEHFARDAFSSPESNTETTEERPTFPTDNSQDEPSGTASSDVPTAEPTTVKPTEVIPATSTPVATFTPTKRPIPPVLKPILPSKIDVPAVNELVVEPTQPPASPEVAASDDSDTDDAGSDDADSDEANSDSSLTNGPSTPVAVDGTGNIEPVVVPTSTPLPNTPTSTRRPNRSTNTPVPTEIPALATNTSAPIVDPATNTPVPSTETSVPPTPEPTRPLPTNTRRPNTSTPIPQPTNTPIIVLPTATVEAATNTPVPTPKPVTDEPSAPTPTPEIVAPTEVPATVAPTNTPLPPAPTNTPVVVPPTPTNTATPEIVAPTPVPEATDTATPNPKLTPPTEPPGGEVPTEPATPSPPDQPPTEVPGTDEPAEPAPTETPKIVVPTATPGGQDGNSGADNDAPQSGE